MMDDRVESFINSRRIAVVGVSKRKFGGTIYKNLKKRGYEVYPVHRSMESFDDDRCFPDLAGLADKVDAAVIAVSPASAESVVDDARAAGISRLWFQQGADFSRPVEKAESAGMQAVSGRCILMYAPPVRGIHAVHRFLARLFGLK